MKIVLPYRRCEVLYRIFKAQERISAIHKRIQCLNDLLSLRIQGKLQLQRQLREFVLVCSIQEDIAIVAEIVESFLQGNTALVKVETQFTDLLDCRILHFLTKCTGESPNFLSDVFFLWQCCAT